MKHALLSIGLVALVSSFGPSAPLLPSASDAFADVCCVATDDPPPDIRDCPFCGGDPTLHRSRFFALEREIVRAMARLVPL